MMVNVAQTAMGIEEICGLQDVCSSVHDASDAAEESSRHIFSFNSRNQTRIFENAQAMQAGAAADRSMIWAMRDHIHITVGLFLAHRCDQLLLLSLFVVVIVYIGFWMTV